MKHRPAFPNHHMFKAHVAKHFGCNHPRYALILRDYYPFSNFPDFAGSGGLAKVVTFPSVEHIPPCIKYSRPETLRFIDTRKSYSTTPLACLTIETKLLINEDPRVFLELDAQKYDRVKEAIALGQIDMPEVRLGADGRPRIVDGKYRVLALHKFGIEKIDVLVPTNEYLHIRSRLLENVVPRRRHKARPPAPTVAMKH